MHLEDTEAIGLWVMAVLTAAFMLKIQKLLVLFAVF
jgi:hypothetical protein